MATSTFTPTTIDYVARGCALLQSSQLINSIVNTEYGAKQFLGLASLAQPQDQTLTFFRPLGARNATIGLSALILSLRGDRMGMATSFALSAIPGVVDAVTCMQKGGEYRLHVIAMGICLGLSWMLVKADS